MRKEMDRSNRLVRNNEDYYNLTCSKCGVVLEDHKVCALNLKSCKECKHFKTFQGLIWDVIADKEYFGDYEACELKVTNPNEDWLQEVVDSGISKCWDCKKEEYTNKYGVNIVDTFVKEEE